jgi:hypothetical protein
MGQFASLQNGPVVTVSQIEGIELRFNPVLSPPLWRRSNESTKCFGEVSLVREAYACGRLGTDNCAIDQDGQKMRYPALDGNDRSCVGGFAFCRVQR